MDKETEKLIRQMLYEKTKAEVLDILDNIETSEVLYVYAYNYNWDNGFEIPGKIIDQKCCDLSTALMVFYRADGFRYMQEKDSKIEGSEDWIRFVERLYLKIVHDTYQRSEIKFRPPLNKVQIYKLSRSLKGSGSIFIGSIGTEDLDIIL